jgi:hypothetical protein
MINVTKSAKEALRRLLNAHIDMPQGRLRLMDRGQGKLGLGIDIEMPGDRLVKHEGATILVVEAELAQNLKGVTLDAEGAELVISYQS